MLERRGFVLLGRNVRVGRLELDIIAQRGSLLVFCEVRTRHGEAFGHPLETIDHRKVKRTREAARRWMETWSHRRVRVRFDAAGVVLRVGAEPEVEYLEGAF